MNTIKKQVLLCTLLLSTFAFWAQSDTGSIDVVINNVKSEKGVILIGLYNSESSFLKNTYKGIKINAKKGTISASFENLKPGTYAISLFHDKDNNGKLNTNFIGIPSEDYAASNNAKGRFGPPKWEDAKFSVSESQKVNQQITL